MNHLDPDPLDPSDRPEYALVNLTSTDEMAVPSSRLITISTICGVLAILVLLAYGIGVKR